MYKVLKAETLAAKIHLMVVHAPRVASHCLPGQFIIVKLDEKGERIPLTICDYDREAGTVTIVFQEIGASTIKMSALKAGDSFRDFVGPLGCPSEFVHEDIEELKKKKMVFVAGGVGTAPVYPQVKWLHEHGVDADVIVGTESRGFIFGAPIAYNLHKPLVLVRKKGKLPCETVEKSYDLEYGSATIEMHKDSIKPGQKVVIVDDLIATGGTIEAAAKLVEELGGTVVKVIFLMELEGLKGRERLKGYDVESVIKYQGK